MPSLIPPGVPGNHPHAGRIAPTAAETTRRQTTTTDQNRTESNKIGVQFDRTGLKNLKKPERPERPISRKTLGIVLLRHEKKLSLKNLKHLPISVQLTVNLNMP